MKAASIQIIENETLIKSRALTDTIHGIEIEDRKENRIENSILKALIRKNKERLKNFIFHKNEVRMF